MRGSGKRQSHMTRIRHGCAAPVLLMLTACFSFLVLPALHILLHERESFWGALYLRWLPTRAAWLPGRIDAASHAGHSHSHPHPHVHLGSDGAVGSSGARAHADHPLQAADSPRSTDGKRHHHGTDQTPGSHGQGAVEHLGCALLDSPCFVFIVTYLPMLAPELPLFAEQVRSTLRLRRHGSRAPPADSRPTDSFPSLI